MHVQLLFDKKTSDEKLNVGWGVSFLVDGRILFDTGEKGDWLLKNMKVLGVDVEGIEAVVISHDHWDHTGGLWDVLAKKKKLISVYGCPGFSAKFKARVRRMNAKLIEKQEMSEISKDIFVSGEIPGEYKGKYMPEQAIAVKTRKGITVITGCAHPGVVLMVEKIMANFPKGRIYSVFGGFHLLDKDSAGIVSIAGHLKGLGVKKAGPIHCSGETAGKIFRERYGRDFIDLKAGEEISI